MADEKANPPSRSWTDMPLATSLDPAEQANPPSLDTAEQANPPSRSWRDSVVASEVNPNRGILAEAPDMELVQDFQEKVGLPRDGIADEPTARAAMTLLTRKALDLTQAAAGNTPEQTKEAVVEQLPTEVAENVQQTEGDSPVDINRAIFDGASFSGELATPEVGDDPLTWIADNAYGIKEENPEFRKAMKGLFQGIDPDKQPWCAAFAGYIFRSLGVEVPTLAEQNPNLAFNYQDIGEEVYNHNPTTGKTYAGSLDAVQTGDVIIFNKNSNRQSDGSFGWGKGHISFVVSVEKDGSILAIGGNQRDRVQTSRYSPDVIKRYYPGGFRVRRITTQSLEQTSPEVIAAITAGIAAGGAGK